MSEQIYSKADVERVARYVINNGTVDIDLGGGRSTHGREYCTDCGVYETGGTINHKHDCIVKVAQDLLTGEVINA